MASSKTVLITGGTGGLGRAVTLAFLQQGANVIVTYRKAEEFNSLKDQPRLQGFQVDVTDESAVLHLIDDIFGKYARLDSLVNTVGGYVGGVKLWDTDPKMLEQMFSLNLRSGYVLSRAVVP